MAGFDADSIADAIQDEVRAEVCGGEDAFVSAIHELSHNITHSRFADTARPFVERLISEKGYIDTLRDFWASRECPKEKLPKNADLLKKLGA